MTDTISDAESHHFQAEVADLLHMWCTRCTPSVTFSCVN